MPRRKLARPNYRLRLRGERFYVDWTDPDTGRGRSVSTGQSERRAAEAWRDQWVAGREQPAPLRQPRIADILDGYVAARTPKVESAETLRLSAETIKHLVGNLEPRMLSSGLFIERRRRTKIPAAPSDGKKPGRAGRQRQMKISDGSIRREGGVLRAAFAWAVREKWIESPPHVELPPVPPPRDRWLTREEVARLIDGCATAHLRLFVILAYHTAARRGAILELTWDRVDLERGLIHYAAPGRRTTRKRRVTVPANAVALAALREAREAAISEHVIEFRGRPVVDVKTAFAGACRRGGIEECSPHILRHSAATHMIMAGVAVGEVARMLGDTVAMVERVYGKHSPDYLRRASDALASA
jgi:integrase